MELPLLVDFLYVDGGRVPGELAAGSRRKRAPSRGLFGCQPSVTVANCLRAIVSRRCQGAAVL